MAAIFNVYANRINIIRQTDTDSFYATWSLTAGQASYYITKKVYNASKKKAKNEKRKFGTVIEGYDVVWEYKVNGTWYPNNTITTTGFANKTSTIESLWSAPSNAEEIRVKVKPLSTSFKSSKSGTSKWFSAGFTPSASYSFTGIPQAPSVGDFTIKDRDLRAVISFDSTASITLLKIQILKDGASFVENGGNNFFQFAMNDTERETGVFTFLHTLSDVGSYQVRASAQSSGGTSQYSSWSSAVDSYPNPPTGVDVKATSDTEVTVSWDAVPNITKYEIEYVDKDEKYFDTSVKTVTTPDGITPVNGRYSIPVTGLNAGTTWYFRVRSVINSVKSEPSSPNFPIVMALKPEPPSTWSSTTNATITADRETTEPVYLYYVHNVQDGSVEQYADVLFTLQDKSYFARIQNESKDDYGNLKNETKEILLWDLKVREIIDVEVIDEDQYDDSIVDPGFNLPPFAGPHNGNEDGTSSEETTPSEDNTSSEPQIVKGLSETEITIHELMVNNTGTRLKWKVRTKGLHPTESDWSIERTINVYVRPVLSLNIVDGNDNPLTSTVTRYPIVIKGSTTPISQKPISYQVSLTALTPYDYTDYFGKYTNVTAGTVVFSQYYDRNTQLDDEPIQLTPSEINLINGVRYSLEVIVYLDSGLNSSGIFEFDTVFDSPEDEDAIVIGDVDYNSDYRYADITPRFEKYISKPHEGYIPHVVPVVSSSDIIENGHLNRIGEVGDLLYETVSGKIYVADEPLIPTDSVTWKFAYDFMISPPNCETIFEEDPDIDIIDGKLPLGAIIGASKLGIMKLGNYTYEFGQLCINIANGSAYRCTTAGDSETSEWEYIRNLFYGITSLDNVTLNVYRLTQNGSYVTIAEDIDSKYQVSDTPIVVRDYHPSFNTCTYRIVAVNNDTGVIYEPSDIMEEIEESSVILQWDERWRDAVNDNGEYFEGYILELPYNITLSEKNSKDVTLADYIGRSRPVAYYGTQMGESLSLSCVFDKQEEDRLALVRQLMVYPGNVYVREPSGLGYWSKVDVSYNRNYDSLVVSVNVDVTPVEGMGI